MTMWIALIILYLIAFCEVSLMESVSESNRILSQAKSKKIKAYYWFKVIAFGLFWPIFSLLVSLHIIIGKITKENEKEAEDEDLP